MIDPYYRQTNQERSLIKNTTPNFLIATDARKRDTLDDYG